MPSTDDPSPSRTRRGRRAAVAGPAVLSVLGILTFALLSLTGATAHGATAPVSDDPSVVAAGQQLYEVHCQSCHGANGVGGDNGSPELIDAGAAAADWYLTTGRMPLNDPKDEAIEKHPFFDPTQIEDLVAYVNALPSINHSSTSGPGIPIVGPVCQGASTDDPAGCTTLSEGQQLYAVNCAQCHQAVGSGGMLSHGNVVPALHNVDLTQIAEAVRVGPKPMPIFGTGQLSDQQVSAIANYVHYLQHPDDRGGMGISHFGPVAEGFVGIIVGLGALLAISRLIGNRG